MVNNVSSFFVKADRFFDRIPVLSSISNLVDLFQKAFVIPAKSRDSVEQNHYYTHLNQKSFVRCVALLVPVLGNIMVGLFDKLNTKRKEQQIQVQSNTIRGLLDNPKTDMDKPNTDKQRVSAVQKAQVEKIFGKTYDGQYIAVRENPLNLKYVREELKSDLQTVQDAVSSNGLALQYASVDLKNNIEVVTSAVQNNGLALQYASKALRKNPEVIEIAVKQNGLALQFADFRETNLELKITIEAVKNNGLALEFANRYFRENLQAVLPALSQNIEALKFVDPSMQNHPKVLAIVEASKVSK